MGWTDVEEMYAFMSLAKKYPHLDPKHLTADLAARIGHDMDIDTRIDKYVTDLEAFIEDLKALKTK